MTTYKNIYDAIKHSEGGLVTFLIAKSDITTEFINSLKERGFTYIILNPNYLNSFNENEKKVILEFVGKVRPMDRAEKNKTTLKTDCCL